MPGRPSRHGGYRQTGLAVVTHFNTSGGGAHLTSNLSISALVSPQKEPEVCDESGEYVQQIEAPTPRPDRPTDEPMEQWIPYRDEYLDALIRMEGRADALKIVGCPYCPPSNNGISGVYRCEDCFGGELVCVDCCLDRHSSLPLHCIKKWNGLSFEPSSLRSLGLRVQLAHRFSSCPASKKSNTNFTVIHTNGLHNVAVDFCGCSGAPHPRVQLLHHQWFPSTVLQPQTCATFEVLHHFHLLTLQSKVTPFSFYSALERQTDNTGLEDVPSRYHTFVRMSRQWRHLKMLKRAGRGHDVSGALGTQSGELAIRCPACPHPGINIPDDWAEVPTNKKFLYQLILAVDANFRLKNRMRGGADCGLGTGWSYFVPSDPYKEYLRGFTNQVEMSTCAGLAALDHANTKNSKGLRVTGVGASTCARQGFLLPTGLGDLQKGERYCNMDYIVFSSLRGTTLERVTISYDIACQWFKKLFSERFSRLPQELQLDRKVTSIDSAIPKFHMSAHKEDCHTTYSLNLRPGVGRTDGEGVERDWSGINSAANSTKEMGEGSRHDTLDDIWGDWNYRKVKGLGKGLYQKIQIALDQSFMRSQEHEQFTKTLRPGDVQAWEAMVRAWESDNKKPDPYVIPASTKTQADIRVELLDAEKRSYAVPASLEGQSPSASTFIVAGLDIEDSQRRLRLEIAESGETRTSNQQANLQERRLLLYRRILVFRSAQKIYMPEVTPELVDEDPDSLITPETIPLHLPSRHRVQSNYFHTPGLTLAGMEKVLRFAQANDSLVELRHSLCIRSHLTKYKHSQVRGQRPNTRARSLLDQAEARTKAIAEKYRAAREAYKNLAGPGEWESTLRPLKAEDLRPLGVAVDEPKEPDRSRGPREGYRVNSWIWMSLGAGDIEGAEMHDALRVEWAKSRARKDRWNEEVLLLHEEMRRVIAFCNWSAERWVSSVTARASQTLSLEMIEGLRAYGFRQAYIWKSRAMQFTKKWALYYSSGPAAPPVPPVNDAAEQDADVNGDFTGDHVDGVWLD